jgi:hypothetical protein
MTLTGEILINVEIMESEILWDKIKVVFFCYMTPWSLVNSCEQSNMKPPSSE